MRSRSSSEGALGRFCRALTYAMVLLGAGSAQAQYDPCRLPPTFTVNINGQHPLARVECELRVDGTNVNSSCKATMLSDGGHITITNFKTGVARGCSGPLPGGVYRVDLTSTGFWLFVANGNVVGADAPMP